MSAWVNGKLDLKCSLDILKRALSNLMPQWADHIRTDPSGKLKMYRYHGAKGEATWERKDVTVNLLLPGSGNPNFPTPPDRSSDNDWGFAIGPDGKWNVYIADHHKNEALQLANKVANQARVEVSRMKMLAMAKLKGYNVTKNEKTKGKIVIEMVVDEEQAKKFMELA